MAVLIDFQAYPVQRTLDILLKDRSTGENIIWATDPPEELLSVTSDRRPILLEHLKQVGYDAVLPRMMKQSAQQQERTKKKGEVFTPAWICCLMNDLLDEQWFQRKSKLPCKVIGQTWENYPEPIPFRKGRKWQTYVDSRRLEICCGEAPFLVSRYDAATGEQLPIGRRIGILDRKLRVVNENAEDEKEWLKWAKRAIQSTYGYEYQGDNLLLARINILLTFQEYYDTRWERMPTDKDLMDVATVISWNLWQMDGLKKTVPFGKPYQEVEQIEMDLFPDEEKLEKATPCKIRDWQGHTRHLFLKMREGAHPMKFDYIIGNPPYQDETLGDNKGYAPPVYDKFLSEAFKVADKVMTIHPARFLFNAGTTPKAWNTQMLNDTHLKVSYYEPDCTKVFSNTDIKGGIAVTYHDVSRDFGAIGTFTPYKELNSIMNKVYSHEGFSSLSDIVITRTAYRLTDAMHKDHPEALSMLSKGHPYDMSTNILDLLPQIFYKNMPMDGFEYILIYGREKTERVYRYIRRDYVNSVINLDKYKLFLPKANSSGQFGETLTLGIIAPPGVGSTETFISIGSYETEEEAINTEKYIKTKFARGLLGALKVTQDITPEKWKCVPLQDFTFSSDIDWSKPIPEIDQQLYRKYNLSSDEIAFIESHVKEME